jgi:hypothetical protein
MTRRQGAEPVSNGGLLLSTGSRVHVRFTVVYASLMKECFHDNGSVLKDAVQKLRSPALFHAV